MSRLVQNVKLHMVRFQRHKLLKHPAKFGIVTDITPFQKRQHGSSADRVYNFKTGILLYKVTVGV